MTEKTKKQKEERLINLVNKINDNHNSNRARHLVKLVAESYKDNPNELKKYFKGTLGFTKNPELSGIATSAFHELTEDIKPIQKYANGGWGSVITTKQEGLKFKNNKLMHSRIKEGALPKSEFNSSAKYTTFEANSVEDSIFEMESGNKSIFGPYSAKNATFSYSAIEAIFKAYSARNAKFNDASAIHAIFEPQSAIDSVFNSAGFMAEFKPHSVVNAKFRNGSAIHAIFKKYSATRAEISGNSAREASFEPNSATGSIITILNDTLTFQNVVGATIRRGIYELNNIPGLIEPDLENLFIHPIPQDNQINDRERYINLIGNIREQLNNFINNRAVTYPNLINNIESNNSSNYIEELNRIIPPNNITDTEIQETEPPNQTPFSNYINSLLNRNIHPDRTEETIDDTIDRATANIQGYYSQFTPYTAIQALEDGLQPQNLYGPFTLLDGELINTDFDTTEILVNALLPLITHQVRNPEGLPDTVKVLADVYGQQGNINGATGFVELVGVESKSITQIQIRQAQDPVVKVILETLSRMYNTNRYRREEVTNRETVHIN